MEITAPMIKELRDRTGAGVMDVKKALTEAKGEMEKAIELLRKAGAAKAAKKAEREAKEGVIGVYAHTTGKLAAMVQLSCETDFVARNKDFKELAHNLAMQVVAMDPIYVKPEEVPAEIVEKEKEILRAQLEGEKKKPEMIEKIIPGKMEKYYSQTCLLKQPYFKNEDITVEELVHEAVIKLGENIQVGKFVRLSL